MGLRRTESVSELTEEEEMDVDERDEEEHAAEERQLRMLR